MEDFNEVALEREADRYFKKYRPYIQVLESKSLLSKVRSITPADVYNLGKQLEAFNMYKRICEEDGTLSQLGRIPSVALDVITVTYGTSPISVIASTQPIDEERGIVYYKGIVAQTASGDIKPGTVVMSATSMEDAPLMNYASGYIEEQLPVNFDGSMASVATNLRRGPVRPGTISFSLRGSGDPIPNHDDGEGSILGRGVSGSIDYATGAVRLDFNKPPTSKDSLVAHYSLDMAAAPDIPKIIFKLISKPVMAQVYALKDTIGLEQSYALRRRFGMIAEDEIANDLVSAINSEIVNTAISKLNMTLPMDGDIQWNRRPSDGVSWFEHKQELKDRISEAEAVLTGKAGRGTVSLMIAGRNAASILSTLPGWTKLSDGSTIGAHIFGTLDGITIIRVPNQAVLHADDIICMYKGASPFESALVYAPYMPLVVTSALPAGINPLLNQKAAAIWAAVEVLVPNFLAKIRVVDQERVISTQSK